MRHTYLKKKKKEEGRSQKRFCFSPQHVKPGQKILSGISHCRSSFRGSGPKIKNKNGQPYKGLPQLPVMIS